MYKKLAIALHPDKYRSGNQQQWDWVSPLFLFASFVLRILLSQAHESFRAVHERWESIQAYFESGSSFWDDPLLKEELSHVVATRKTARRDAVPPKYTNDDFESFGITASLDSIRQLTDFYTQLRSLWEKKAASTKNTEAVKQHESNIKNLEAYFHKVQSVLRSHKCFALTLPKHILVWIFAGYKQWEGRTKTSLKRKGGVPCTSCSVCLFAGSAGRVYCKIKQVVVVDRAVEVITRSNWQLFVPWVRSYKQAISLYDDLCDGSGFVFMRLSYPYKYINIGSVIQRQSGEERERR